MRSVLCRGNPGTFEWISGETKLARGGPATRRPDLTVLTSRIATSAKAVGAASLPFSSRFII